MMTDLLDSCSMQQNDAPVSTDREQSESVTDDVEMNSSTISEDSCDGTNLVSVSVSASLNCSFVKVAP